ncbi:MAG: SUMF1/EgtB/PvdO family nonheme iron enzyme [Parasphingorhabdus sp.]|uniref:formylglycine-generating enzyme family protein n=1 Tax=Parasphingorhabdus sp. TaxID=2709688 RepID=UPI0032980957
MAIIAGFSAPAHAQTGPESFSDCENCPAMIIIPSGSAMIGAEPYEANQKRGDIPVRKVTIGYKLAVGRTEITRAQYRQFMEESGHAMATDGCNSWGRNRIMGYVPNHHWDNPGFSQNDNHPVVCVSHVDASAYARWMAQKTGKPYRLLSSTEFEYATRAGTRGPWFWGTSQRDACTYANVADDVFRKNFDHAPVFKCDDGYEHTAPVATYEANGWGLHDMLGNVYEWTNDCVHTVKSNAPTDGRAWLEEDGGNCERRVPRGGSWVSGTDWVRAAAQAGDLAKYHSQLLGFRVAVTLP